MAKLKLYFSYEGTRYHGFQRQRNTPHTIQEIFEGKLSAIFNTSVKILASGRTDAGVHARIQVAHAEVPDASVERMLSPVREPSIAGPRLLHALNRLLPHDIRLLKVEKAKADFHALRDARRKTYLYFIDTSPTMQWPAQRKYSWHLKFPLNWEAIDRATLALTGRHDFTAFCGKGAAVKSKVRTIHEAYWERIPGPFCPSELRVFRITGSGFLKQMVRSIVGTLVHIGNGKAESRLVQELLENPDRRQSGPTAPPQGLWLWDILYP